MARAEERKGAKIFLGNNKVMIDGEWWFWHEEEGTLRDRLGKEREGKREKIRRKGKGGRRGREARGGEKG